jgi:hypothetical protein
MQMPSARHEITAIAVEAVAYAALCAAIVSVFSFLAM